MYCKNCNKEISDNASFCRYCGSAVNDDVDKKICPKCGKNYEFDFMFCEECGYKLIERTLYKQPTKKSGTNTSDEIMGQIIEPFKKFLLNSKISSAKDDLTYKTKTDRSSLNLNGLETKKQEFAFADEQSSYKNGSDALMKYYGFTYYEGEPKLSFGGKLGTLTITKDKINFKVTFGGVGKGFLDMNKNIEIPLEQITTVHLGNYGVIYTTIIITEKNGTKHSFVPSVPGSDTQTKKIMQSIQTYMDSLNNNL